MEWESVQELKAQFVREGPAVALAGATLAAGRPESLRITGPSIALGAAPTEREDDYRLAVRIQRRELLESTRLAQIVESAKGEADVEYVGRAFKQPGGPPPLQQRCRPLSIGCSVGHHAITAGSLGCFVETADGLRMLSNNHVLADEDRGSAGDAILQPGRHDGGTEANDAIGSLARAVPLNRAGGNRFDAALAELEPGVSFEAADLDGLGPLSGVSEPSRNLSVAKVGRTTGTSFGRVIAIDLDDVWIGYETGELRFDGVIQVAGADGLFTEGGDSGSLVVANEDKPHGIGLHFAGYENGTSIAAPLAQLLGELRASLVS